MTFVWNYLRLLSRCSTRTTKPTARMRGSLQQRISSIWLASWRTALSTRNCIGRAKMSCRWVTLCASTRRSMCATTWRSLARNTPDLSSVAFLCFKKGSRAWSVIIWMLQCLFCQPWCGTFFCRQTPCALRPPPSLSLCPSMYIIYCFSSCLVPFDVCYLSQPDLALVSATRWWPFSTKLIISISLFRALGPLLHRRLPRTRLHNISIFLSFSLWVSRSFCLMLMLLLNKMLASVFNPSFFLAFLKNESLCLSRVQTCFSKKLVTPVADSLGALTQKELKRSSLILIRLDQQRSWVCDRADLLCDSGCGFVVSLALVCSVVVDCRGNAIMMWPGDKFVSDLNVFLLAPHTGFTSIWP